MLQPTSPKPNCGWLAKTRSGNTFQIQKVVGDRICDRKDRIFGGIGHGTQMPELRSRRWLTEEHLRPPWEEIVHRHHQQREIEMDTSPKATSNADIKRKLNEIVDYHLFESTSWPLLMMKCVLFSECSKRWDCRRPCREQRTQSAYTALGIDCGTELASCFIGAHEPYEIPRF